MLSFSRHNLHLVDLGQCLLIAVMKFQETFACLRQLNSPNSWDKFHILLFLQYFACFCEFPGFTWISRLHDRAEYQKPCITKESDGLHIHSTLSTMVLSIFWTTTPRGNREFMQLFTEKKMRNSSGVDPQLMEDFRCEMQYSRTWKTSGVNAIKKNHGNSNSEGKQKGLWVSEGSSYRGGFQNSICHVKDTDYWLFSRSVWYSANLTYFLRNGKMISHRVVGVRLYILQGKSSTTASRQNSVSSELLFYNSCTHCSTTTLASKLAPSSAEW